MKRVTKIQLHDKNIDNHFLCGKGFVDVVEPNDVFIIAVDEDHVKPGEILAKTAADLLNKGAAFPVDSGEEVRNG